ncbi:MAG: class IV adenylate cyclase [Peptoniphilus sp.]|nr:class IV adenylate cyclase [Peptoniphilus sp.]MDD7363098.1 class IV adenylate cyclase [Bacillota bacterium]MDY6044380.1 class IV adenylate cyclase [Peptoniphilus sp.]
MEREIEVKVLNVDLSAMEKTLIEKGGVKISDEQQETIVINSSKHPIDDASGYLRIRRTRSPRGDKTVCTFKEKKANDAVRIYDEHTVEIDDVEEMLRIFELLGYNLRDEGHKHRISYAYRGCRLDLDRWEEETYPAPYMEIEGGSREAIQDVIDDLGIDRRCVSTKSIAELRKWQNKK